MFAVRAVWGSMASDRKARARCRRCKNQSSVQDEANAQKQVAEKGGTKPPSAMSCLLRDPRSHVLVSIVDSQPTVPSRCAVHSTIRSGRAGSVPLLSPSAELLRAIISGKSCRSAGGIGAKDLCTCQKTKKQGTPGVKKDIHPLETQNGRSGQRGAAAAQTFRPYSAAADGKVVAQNITRAHKRMCAWPHACTHACRKKHTHACMHASLAARPCRVAAAAGWQAMMR